MPQGLFGWADLHLFNSLATVRFFQSPHMYHAISLINLSKCTNFIFAAAPDLTAVITLDLTALPEYCCENVPTIGLCFECPSFVVQPSTTL